MAVRVKQVLKIKVPLTVLLAEKSLSVQEILDLAPGAVVQFSKSCEAPLQLLANGRTIGTGVAVKVNERFGLQVREMGDPDRRISALSADE